MTDCNLSNDGRLVVSSSDIDHSVKLWDCVTGKMVKEIKGTSKSKKTFTAETK